MIRILNCFHLQQEKKKKTDIFNFQNHNGSLTHSFYYVKGIPFSRTSSMTLECSYVCYLQKYCKFNRAHGQVISLLFNTLYSYNKFGSGLQDTHYTYHIHNKNTKDN